MLGLSNFLTLQTFRAKQKHLVRINHTRIPPLRSSRSPLIKFFLRAPNTGTNFVAQGAAPFAGPEAFSLWRRVRPSGNLHQLSVLNSAPTKKSPGAPVMNQNRLSSDGSVVAQVAQAMILGQRDLRLLSCKSAYVAASASPLEYALTQKGGRGYPPRTSSASGHSRSNEVGGEEQLRPKADPAAKIRPRDDNVGAGLSTVASARGRRGFERSAGLP